MTEIQLIENLSEAHYAAVRDENLRRPLDYLETTLSDRQSLIGDSISVVDLNVAVMIELMAKQERIKRPKPYTLAGLLSFTSCFYKGVIFTLKLKL